MASSSEVQNILHQSPKEVIMIRPGFFGFDNDTMESNAFQNDLSGDGKDEKEIHENALDEVSDIHSDAKICKPPFDLNAGISKWGIFRNSVFQILENICFKMYSAANFCFNKGLCMI